ncbi:D-sedoheptulose 7-phosphate isomerase [Desulfobacterales bacterium HSG16]|nr:D-sedoheptulose 7-phosphate isomerase [Desulfobacterales bacterium HSG16]
MESVILNILDESIRAKKAFVQNHTEKIITCAKALSACIASDHKILIFGNGGSAADAQHIAAEFVNRFQIERPPLPAIALTTDTSIITSIGNDYSFSEIFSKQVQAIGFADDAVVGISTSGNSENVIKAMETAKDKGLLTIGFSGPGGKLTEIADISFAVPSDVTARIQETHILLGHMLCDLVDRILFP